MAGNERKTAVVTGSAGTLGRALALRLARAGWRLALVDLAEAENQETLRLVLEAGGEARAETCDLRAAEAWRDLHDRLRAEWPTLDLLVNNAGVAGAGEVGSFSLDDWQWVLDTNLKSVVLGCHTFVDWLKENSGGAAIVNVASCAAFACFPSMAAYNVAKAGVVALSETLSIELAAHGVGVTVVCPGFFASGLLATARMQKPEHREFTERLMREAKFTADDVAAASLQAAARRELYVILPRRARTLWRLKRFLPNLYRRYITRRYNQEMAE